MFIVIYSFQVKANREAQFIKAWTSLTELIYKYEGSLGSRLHHEKDNQYLAYAQWPSRETWENFGSKLPAQAKAYSQSMNEACDKTETLHTLSPISDLLKQTPASDE